MAYATTTDVKFNGRNYPAGSEIKFTDKDAQAKLELLDAGAIEGEDDQSADPRALLKKMTDAQRVETARAESVVIPEGVKGDKLIDLIMQARARDAEGGAAQ